MSFMRRIISLSERALVVPKNSNMNADESAFDDPKVVEEILKANDPSDKGSLGFLLKIPAVPKEALPSLTFWAKRAILAHASDDLAAKVYHRMVELDPRFSLTPVTRTSLLRKDIRWAGVFDKHDPVTKSELEMIAEELPAESLKWVIDNVTLIDDFTRKQLASKLNR